MRPVCAGMASIGSLSVCRLPHVGAHGMSNLLGLDATRYLSATGLPIFAAEETSGATAFPMV